MPCPHFNPTQLRLPRTFENGRFPLIEEYDGTCDATGAASPDSMVHAYCNHGYAQGICPQLPETEQRSAIRYHVVQRTNERLEILCIEESRHEPVGSFRFEFVVSTGEIRDGWPSRYDSLRIQAEAFCRSYLARFPGRHA